MRTVTFAGVFGLALLGLTNAPRIRAQPATAPQFEVASVKPSPPSSNGVRGDCHGIDSKYSLTEAASAPPLGRCVITDGRLSHMISLAYGLRSINLIKGAPDWVIAGTERFNLEAKVEDPTKATEQQLLRMLQALLVDRFKLKFHRENVDVPGFAMVVAKNGPKLREATGDDVELSFGASSKPGPGAPVNLTLRKYTMQMLADLLSQLGPGPVKDQTGLTGAYDFKLSWDEANGPSVFTAIQEQLGLRLEPQKVPVPLFVFESAQKPLEN